MQIHSLLREEEMRVFSRIELFGEVLDVGGLKKSNYLTHTKGVRHVTTVNLGTQEVCDVVHDLEHVPLPFSDSTYDAVVLNNTLEHIYNNKELVKDCHRLLKMGGCIVVTVPFLFPIHPSPHDYMRFTEEGITTLLREVGFLEIQCTPLGVGLHTVCFHFFERLLPHSFRVVTQYFRPLARCIDTCFIYLFQIFGKTINAHTYALGYFVVGKK